MPAIRRLTVDKDVRIDIALADRGIVLTPTPTETQLRLDAHKATLAGWGITDLSSLGKLPISGNVVPAPGLTIPPQQSTTPVPRPTTTFQSAFRLVAARGANRAHLPVSRSLVSIGGTAQIMPTIPHPAAPPAAPSPGGGAFPRMLARMNVPIAYWAATWIDIAANTNVIFQFPARYLVILTEKLTVGSNVTFTWERPAQSSPPKPLKPGKPSPPPTSTTIAKPAPATAGSSGGPGGPGGSGLAGAELEVWALDISGTPAFDFAGQDGQQGGPGGDGGDGADGAPGKPDAANFWGCTSGPGNGGDGGPGGAGGRGGDGGTGGDGGKFSLFAPQPVITAYQNNFYVSVGGGAAGAGGIPGTPGAGGAGGPRGDNSHKCQPADDPATGKPEVRSAGNPGAQGAAGTPGTTGSVGAAGSMSMKAIDADDFRRKLLIPALALLTPSVVKQGDSVTATGERFTATDHVTVGGVAAQTTVSSDKLLTFTVPATPGGVQTVQLTQADGTQSNRASLYVRPTLSSTQPAHARPGSVVRLTGTGFAPGAIVEVNGQAMPGVTYVDPHTVDFTLLRPTSVGADPADPAAETAQVQVVLADRSASAASNVLPMTLATFRYLVFGDSIAWGQGLEEASKFHSLVEQAIRAKHGDIGVHKIVLAHSGAIIGLTPPNTTVLPALDGEVPTSFPTIAQQVASVTTSPDEVDFVLLDGGINDIDVTTILNPLTPTSALVSLVDTHCHIDMRTLLNTTASKFPNARIVVTGYYQIISEDTDLAGIEALLIAAGVLTGGVLGGAAAGTFGAVEREEVINQCKTFSDEANTKLALAVSEANGMLAPAPARIFFADPMFGPRNAALAPDAFVYGINADLSPQDTSTAGPRATACAVAGPTRTEVDICQRASIGHPNARGAARYAEAVLPFVV